MTMENLQPQIGIPSMQLAERYAEYSGPAHEPAIYYPYEPSPPTQGPVIATKHHFGGSHDKNNAAMSALTLLAFLFFLHILQQCLKDHMTAMSTPQVMIMTSGREGEENIAKLSRNKIDKTGEINTNRENERNVDTTDTSSSENYLMKIVTSDNAQWSKTRNNQNAFKKYVTQSPASSKFFNPPEDY